MTKIGTLCFMGILLYGSICFYLPIQFYLAYAEFEYCSEIGSMGDQSYGF